MYFRQSKPMAMARWPATQTVKPPAKEAPAISGMPEAPAPLTASMTNSEDSNIATNGSLPNAI